MERSILLKRITIAIIVVFCLLAEVAIANTAPEGAVAPDKLDQRLAACMSCHGKQGMGSKDNPHIPRLAGKPAPYLLKQLKLFQSGKRHYPPMEYVVSQLSPAYLRIIADYFSHQNAPYYQHSMPEASTAMMRQGEELVRHGDKSHGVPACESCHGSRLTGVDPWIPGLAGLSYQYIQAQLELWRTHDRNAGSTFCMGVVANRMSEQDIKAVSAWLAQQPVPENQHPIQASELDQAIPGWCVLGTDSGKTP